MARKTTKEEAEVRWDIRRVRRELEQLQSDVRFHQRLVAELGQELASARAVLKDDPDSLGQLAAVVRDLMSKHFAGADEAVVMIYPRDDGRVAPSPLMRLSIPGPGE